MRTPRKGLVSDAKRVGDPPTPPPALECPHLLPGRQVTGYVEPATAFDGLEQIPTAGYFQAGWQSVLTTPSQSTRVTQHSDEDITKRSASYY